VLNEGIKTAVLDLARWLDQPDVSSADIVDAMKLPHGMSVEALLIDEMKALDSYQGTWSTISGGALRELYLRNSACKRALYLSAPILLPDTISVDSFVATAVNSRIHVYEAADVRDTIRLEAVSSYTVGGLRFRYALSIQYADDSIGLGWQIIRPVVIVDPRALAAARRGGEPARTALRRVLDALGRLILSGSHDYVHATVLNWFPPLADLSPSYAAICSERVHPPEVDQWHAGTQAALPDGLLPDRPTPGIATLELYSLMVHGQVIARMWQGDPAVRTYLLDTAAEFDAALTEFLATADFADPEVAEQAGDYFTTLAGWFLVSALPLGSDRLAEVAAVFPTDRWRRVRGYLASVHGGMFDLVRFVADDRFPWRGRLVPVHDVGFEYEAALRRPALRAHLTHLLSPRCDGAVGATCWLDALTARLGASERADLRTGLTALAGWDDSTEQGRHRRTAQLRRLADSGGLEMLRAVVRGRDTAGGGAMVYVRGVLADFVRAADAPPRPVRPPPRRPGGAARRPRRRWRACAGCWKPPAPPGRAW
jgi:hypothetical protein